MIAKVSTLAGYLAIFSAGIAAGLVMLAFIAPAQGETIARLAYIAAVTGFCFFTFWAVSATLTALANNRSSGK